MAAGVGRPRPEEYRALLPAVRGLKLVQRHRPAVFNHIVRGIALMGLRDLGPEADALREKILREYPA